MANKKIHFLAGSLEIENKPGQSALAKIIGQILSDCEGYYGYKLTSLGRSSDLEAPTFLAVTREHGVILIDFLEENISSVEEQDNGEVWKFSNDELIFSRTILMELFEDEVISRLKNDYTLYDRKLKKVRVPINTVLVFFSNTDSEIETLKIANSTNALLVGSDNLEANLKIAFDKIKSDKLPEEDLDKIISLIEGTYIYENKFAIAKDAPAKSINDFIKKSLERTFKQDDAQRLISMQLPDGPQRIRGLAGTGKTIVLSLKAAITHKRLKDFKILYLFNTQSLYGHITSLISKYYVSEAKRSPDFENKLHIYHAWGGKGRAGLYSELCKSLGLSPKRFEEVKSYSDPLAYIYRDLLKRAGDLIVPIYDLVLIDEAQDLPQEVFEVIYKITKEKKRIIWAYDEFQSLREMRIKGPDELFGLNKDGKPNISSKDLEGEYAGGIKKDSILPNCYRTPRPVLMTAHGVALGLYREEGVLQMFDSTQDWEAIGYKVLEPKNLVIKAHDNVVLERPDQTSKNLLEGLITEAGFKSTDLVNLKKFDGFIDEIQYVTTKIAYLINVEQVPAHEIIVINLSTGNNKSDMQLLRSALSESKVLAVIPGYVESSDLFKVENHVTITTPYRAKGNEASVVFVINSQRVILDSTLRGRNAFFVAVTRSRGWCYLTGNGKSMTILENEINKLKKDFPKMIFERPSDEEIAQRRNLLNKSDKELNALETGLEVLDKNPDFVTSHILNNPALLKLLKEKLQNEEKGGK